MVGRELAAFLIEGHSSHIASRNERLEPNAARVTALTVDDDGHHVVAYVPSVSADPVLADLRANGQAAIVVTRPTDDRGCQVKGVFVDARAAGPEDQSLVRAQWDHFLDVLEMVGLPRAATESWIVWPCIAIRIRVQALFDQTPGPGAGAPLS
ncbi:MAG: hypothetical protein R2712_31555 [Vicinamibacterales bacterium]